MRAVVQRVSRARVDVSPEGASPFTSGVIQRGLLVYAAAAPDDGDADVTYMAEKIAALRIFPDDQGRMNRDVRETGGGVLLVSAFTVLADARKGRRPSFDGAARGEIAAPLVEALANVLRTAGIHVETGRFAEHMDVESVNDGPICILLDSRRTV